MFQPLTRKLGAQGLAHSKFATNFHNTVAPASYQQLPHTPCRVPYEARVEKAQNAMARRCFEIMARKRTNLSVAADVATAEEMLSLADAVGPHICVFKTHVDIFDRCQGGGLEVMAVLLSG